MQLTPVRPRDRPVHGRPKFRVSDLTNPEINVRYGTWYLRHLLDSTDDERLALAAYNAGQDNVDRWRSSSRGIQFSETRAYVEQVEASRRSTAAPTRAELGLELTLPVYAAVRDRSDRRSRSARGVVGHLGGAGGRSAEPKAGEVLVRLVACGVCHTDLLHGLRRRPVRLRADGARARGRRRRRAGRRRRRARSRRATTS